jgi:hypothetical protein
MDQTCPVAHKSRRPQARLKTVTLFYIHCALDDRFQTGFLVLQIMTHLWVAGKKKEISL